MAKTTLNSFIQQRARVLAMVQFSSRPDLQVVNFPEDGGLDLLVRITSEDQGYEKVFGVELKGTKRTLSTAEQADSHLRPKFSIHPLPKYSFPVIVLLFSMEDDRGYSAWYIEPIVNQSSEPRLKVHESPSFTPFDRSALATIVTRVNVWHDSLVTLLENV